MPRGPGVTQSSEVATALLGLPLDGVGMAEVAVLPCSRICLVPSDLV